ncbi:hypothetical protein TeGR_g4330 [Tetraparma gracilis]|uniref:Uncharacterized protein n=1 Tax=Tetraparma gracilis TaxID=2962635 RepID=A0ABQ6M4J5_9STRA|nr:hypothetical protein TeGR_g4330 [Tetraparma gracilis]
MALPKVGFGKHSQLSYSALKKQQPAYCSWVLAQSFPSGSPQARLQAHLRGAPRGASPPLPRSSSPRRPNPPLIANVVGSSAQTAKEYLGLGSWKEVWVKSTHKPWPRLCAYSGCRNPPAVGGHVYIKNQKSGYFIVPICTSCNLSGKRDWRRGETAWTRTRSTLVGPVSEISDTKTLWTDGETFWDARRTRED